MAAYTGQPSSSVRPCGEKMSSNKNSWWGKRLGLLGAAALLFLLAGGLLSGSAAADDDAPYPLMHPDQETLQEWIEAYNTAPRAHMVAKGAQLPGPTGSLSLLSRLDYIPSERNQGSCGNCWAWAGTGCLGIALDVQQGIHDRLSVQYINSCQDYPGCCAPGWLSHLANFYDPPTGYNPGTNGTGQCLPWSNTNAHWQDGDVSCDTSCGSISTDPNYPISSIYDVTIATQTVDQATAIANIKDVLHQGKAVWFAFFVPDSSAWSDFCDFWNNNGESVAYDIDQFCGAPSGINGGHAVLCVGYDDAGPDPHWVMLNSWGTAGGNRSNGLFRVDMDMAYDCSYGSSSSPFYYFYWQTLDVTFGIPGITVSPSSFDVTLPRNTSQDYTLTIGNDGGLTLSYTISDGGCSWLGEVPTSGFVEPGQSDPITVAVDTAGLAAGDHHADIVISSNDPYEGTKVVPVALHVVAPDLIITQKCEQWVDPQARTYTITYVICNSGGQDAGASSTAVFIDGVDTLHDPAPPLAPDECYYNTLGPFTMSGDSDTINICADCGGAVDEGDETNNCRENTFAYRQDEEIQIALKAGWNMVSVPVVPGDTTVSSVFPSAQAVYTWDPATRSYYMPTDVEPEKGYWVAVIADTNITMTGVIVSTWTSSLTAGWNMIGSIYGKDVDFTDPYDNPDGSVQGFAYWWDPSTRSYALTYTLESKKGYWAAATQNCQLTLS